MEKCVDFWQRELIDSPCAIVRHFMVEFIDQICKDHLVRNIKSHLNSGDSIIFENSWFHDSKKFYGFQNKLQARAEAFPSPKAGQAESVKTFSDQEKECGALATRCTANLGGAEVTDAQQSSPGIPPKRRVFPMASWRNPWWIESEYYVRLIVDFKKLDPTPVMNEFSINFPSPRAGGAFT